MTCTSKVYNTLFCFIPMFRHRFLTVVLWMDSALLDTTKLAQVLLISLAHLTETGKNWSRCCCIFFFFFYLSMFWPKFKHIPERFTTFVIVCMKINGDHQIICSKVLSDYNVTPSGNCSSPHVFLLSPQCPPLFKKECNKCLQVPLLYCTISSITTLISCHTAVAND